MTTELEQLAEKEKYYKVLAANGAAPFGQGIWHLPRGDKPGKWMPSVKGRLKPCENGYHVVTRDGLIDWLGPELYEVEVSGEGVPKDEHVLVVRRTRLIRRLPEWNESTARLFAADCAERVLPVFEKSNPGDDRPRKAIEAARAFAQGEISEEDLAAARDAARDAAWAAAREAARDAAKVAAWEAAWAAARAAAWEAAWDAAWDAARAAAWDAAWDATWAAAWAAAWDAAWDATRAAAWDATRAATRDAAWDATRAATRDAAWDAERQWQTQRLLSCLEGG